MSTMQVEVEPGYESLFNILVEALEQAQHGKGKERHANGENFERQIICEVARRVGVGYQLGQSVKKIYESERLNLEPSIKELLGSINYNAAAIIVKREAGAE